MRLKKYYSLLLGSLCVILAIEGCTPCSFSTTGGFSNELWGKWKLVKVVLPSKTEPNVTHYEILKIGSLTSNGTSVISDSTLRDSTLVGVNEWVGIPGQECKTSAITITYKGGLQRKFWIQNKGMSLEATAYVNQIGSRSDTIRYYYNSL